MHDMGVFVAEKMMIPFRARRDEVGEIQRGHLDIDHVLRYRRGASVAVIRPVAEHPPACIHKWAPPGNADKVRRSCKGQIIRYNVVLLKVSSLQ